LFGALARLFRAVCVDFGIQLGGFGQNQDVILSHLGHAAMDGVGKLSQPQLDRLLSPPITG
jgi:hypothetical protein